MFEKISGNFQKDSGKYLGRFWVMSLKIPENLTELGKNVYEAAIVSATHANLPKLAEILTKHYSCGRLYATLQNDF